jgi:hypothetical protein
MGEMQPGSGGDHVGRKKKQQQQQQESAAAGDSAVVVGCRKKNSGRMMQGAGRGGQVQPAAAAGSRPKQQQQQQQLVVVGMDLTASCREMLTWVLTKQAQPGDHIVAVHVSAFSALVRHPAAAAAASGGNVIFAQRLFCLVPARVVLSFRALVAEETLVIIS